MDEEQLNLDLVQFITLLFCMVEVESSERSKKKPKQAASTQNESPQKSRSGTCFIKSL